MPRVLSEQEYTAMRDQVLQHAPAGLAEDEFQRYVGPAMEQALGILENTPAPLQGSSLSRALSGLWSTINPMGLVQAAIHPIETAKGLARAQVGEFQKIGAAPTVYEKGAHLAAGLLPVLGPVAARTGEQMVETGDIARGVGAGAGLLAPFAADAVISKVRQVRGATQAPIVERQATQQVAEKVLGPGNPKYKGRAQAIAPDVLARGMKGGRAELAQAAEEGMASAADQIDTAIAQAGGVSADIPVSGIIGKLQARMTELRDSKGIPLSDAAAGRIKALQQRITQLKAMGGKRGSSVFEDLRKLRDESYRVADEARGYERAGNPAMATEGWAARELGSAVRETFAERSPAHAAANADYTFFKTLNDVLDPTLGRPKSLAPPAGVTGGSRTVGAVVGSFIGPKAAFVTSVFLPWLKDRMADASWQLMDAQSKMALAQALKRGDVGRMQRVMLAVGKYEPRATSPSESQSPTTAPAY